MPRGRTAPATSREVRTSTWSSTPRSVPGPCSLIARSVSAAVRSHDRFGRARSPGPSSLKAAGVGAPAGAGARRRSARLRSSAPRRSSDRAPRRWRRQGSDRDRGSGIGVRAHLPRPRRAIRSRRAIRPSRPCARSSHARCRDRCPARGRSPRSIAPRRAAGCLCLALAIGLGAAGVWSRTACRCARGRGRPRTRCRTRRTAGTGIALHGAGELQPQGADQAVRHDVEAEPVAALLPEQTRRGAVMQMLVDETLHAMQRRPDRIARHEPRQNVRIRALIARSGPDARRPASQGARPPAARDGYGCSPRSRPAAQEIMRPR